MTLVRCTLYVVSPIIKSAYDFDFEPGVMVTDSCGQCYYKDMKNVSGKNGGTWKCTAKCKAMFYCFVVIPMCYHQENLTLQCRCALYFLKYLPPFWFEALSC